MKNIIPSSEINGIISPDEVEYIHSVGLKILAKIGAKIEDPYVADLLCKNGCIQDGDRVKMPSAVIEDVMSQVPDSITLYNRNGLPAYCIDNHQTLVQPVGETPFIIDPRTNQKRLALKKDLQNIVRLIEKLDSISLVTLATVPSDIDKPISLLDSFAVMLSYSSKPVNTPGLNSSEEVQWLARLAEAASPSVDLKKKPSVVVSILPSSPLTFNRGTVQALCAATRIGLPIAIVPLPIMGISAPFDLAGGLAQQHAENLAAVVIAQKIKSGSPIIYHGRLSVGNMRSGNSLWGLFQVGLAGAAATALGRRCGMPTNVYGFSTSSHSSDIQSGLERAVNCMLPMLAGANILGGAGSLCNLMVVDPLQLIIDNEFVQLFKTLKKKADWKVDSKLLDEIQEVSGKEGGTFMLANHTLNTLRSEGQWIGTVSDRSDDGEKGQRMLTRAKEMLLQHLDSDGNGPLLPDASLQIMESILATAKLNFH